MRIILLFIAVVFFFPGCKSKTKIPTDVLPPAKMEKVLWDLMRADQFLADYVLNKDLTLNKDSQSVNLYQQIFSIHKVSKEKFKKSFDFYQLHPDLLKVIMDSLSHTPVVDTVLNKRNRDSVLKIDTQINPLRKDSLLPKFNNRRLRRN